MRAPPRNLQGPSSFCGPRRYRARRLAAACAGRCRCCWNRPRLRAARQLRPGVAGRRESRPDGERASKNSRERLGTAAIDIERLLRCASPPHIRTGSQTLPACRLRSIQVSTDHAQRLMLWPPGQAPSSRGRAGPTSLCRRTAPSRGFRFGRSPTPSSSERPAIPAGRRGRCFVKTAEVSGRAVSPRSSSFRAGGIGLSGNSLTRGAAGEVSLGSSPRSGGLTHVRSERKQRLRYVAFT